MELYVQFAGQFGHNSGIIKHFLLHSLTSHNGSRFKHFYKCELDFH